MKKLSVLLVCAAIGLSASAVTLEDLCGTYELQNAYGSLSYICAEGYTTFGLADGDTEANADYINNIKVVTDGQYLYFSNFLGLTFYAEPNLEANKVVIPVQYVTAPTGFSFMQCLYESTMFPAEQGGTPEFDETNAQPIELYITADGDLSLYNEEAQSWNMIAYWGWSTNYGYLDGVFHKTGDLVPDPDVEPILGVHKCTEFQGSWNSIWGDWDNTYSIWNNFNIETGEGIEKIGVDAGPFDVTISSLGGREVSVDGLWWGGLSITGEYDAETKTITFPLQTVWGGYTLCNSSLCSVEVPTAADVVPATATIEPDGSIEMHYTVSYSNYPYLTDMEQVLAPVESGVDTIAEESVNAPKEYYNFQGVRVANPAPGQFVIVRQGSKTSKQVVR